jgi:hypothetical protein
MGGPEPVDVSGRVRGARALVDKRNVMTQNAGGRFESQFNKTMGGEFATQLLTNFDTVQGMTTSLPSFVEAERLINDPNTEMFTGPLANVMVAMGGVLSSAGFKAAEDPTANTQQFAALMGNETLNIMSSGALGVGTALSDNDLKFAKAVVAGEITLDRQAIIRVMRINKEAKRAVILEHNKRLLRIKGDMPVNLKIDMPAYLMTPAEKRAIMAQGQ